MLDLLSLQLLLSIIAASGVIAYVADRLGKKLGKKRLSIRVGRYSLRPKHVATLGTVLMGLVVSIVTIALVAAASSDARTWLLEGRQLLIQREQLRQDNERLQLERGHLSQERKDLSDANERLKGDNEELQKKILDQQKSLDEERGRLAKAQAQRQGLEAEAARLEREASRLGAQVASLRRNQALTESALANSHKQLVRNQTALRLAQNALKAYQAQIREAIQELQTSKANGDVAYKNWQEAARKSNETYQELVKVQGEVEAAKAQVTDLTAQREKAEKDLAATQLQYTTAQTRLDQAIQQLIEAKDLADRQQGFLNSAVKNARTEAMTFRAREEVARVVVPGGADSTAAQAALTSLIRTARLEAADRGAKSSHRNGQTFEVADVFDRQDPESKVKISSEDLKAAVISRVEGRVEDQVLVATSSLNAFAGEPVSLDISVFPNPLIYHQGEMLSEARIDGSLPEEEIFAQISEFVRSRVKERATQDRMIPKSMTDAPFGTVPPADMFALVRDIKRVGRPVRVQAIAGDNIRAADPLRLEFRLK